MYQDMQTQIDQMQPFLIEILKFHSIKHLFINYLNNHHKVHLSKYHIIYIINYCHKLLECVFLNCLIILFYLYSYFWESLNKKDRFYPTLCTFIN